MKEFTTLILNSGYQPIEARSWQEAFCLIYRGKAEMVAEYEDVAVYSANDIWPIPAVLRLTDYARPASRRPKFCRENVYTRDNYACQYCGKKFKHAELTYDHVTPRAKGGVTSWTNIVTSCKPCNSAKGDKTPFEANMQLRSQPHVPNTQDLRQRVLAKSTHVPKEWAMWL